MTINPNELLPLGRSCLIPYHRADTPPTTLHELGKQLQRRDVPSMMGMELLQMSAFLSQPL